MKTIFIPDLMLAISERNRMVAAGHKCGPLTPERGNSGSYFFTVVL